MRQWKLRYDKPADRFIDALPLGNGHMGAMVYGGWKEEHLSLNLDTLWSGPMQNRLNSHGKADLEHLRTLILEHKHQEAHEYIYKNMLGKYGDIYEPAGDLYLSMMDSNCGEVSGYERILDLNQGLFTCTYEVDGVRYEKEIFTSLKEKLLVIRIRAEQEKTFGMNVSMDAKLRWKEDPEVCADEIGLTGKAPMGARYRPEDENLETTRYALTVRVEQSGGSLEKKDNTIQIRGAQEIRVYLTGETSFDATVPGYLAKGDDWKNDISQTLERAAMTGYEKLKEEHTALWRSYFERMDLELEGEDQDVFEKMTTPERIFQYQKEKKDLNLPILLFHFGRYLTIAGSMPGSQPTTLQGIWNEDLVPAWSCGYTTNINLQMNYWLTGVCNLSEFQEPLFDLMERIAKDGREVAKKVYGMNGWVCHHETSITGHAQPEGGEWDPSDPVRPVWFGMWPMGGGWLCQHLWEHYCYTQDKEFLEQRAYPLMEGAIAFFLDFLTPHEGYLVTNPSTSPENSFWADGKRYAATIASTMDSSILKEFFQNYLEVLEILGKEEHKKEVEEALEKLPPYKIGRFGQLQEWYEDLEEGEVDHRHTSHLYGLHPANLIRKEDVTLREACIRTLERRQERVSGWSSVWRACFWARLGDGNHAKSLLDFAIRYSEDTREAASEEEEKIMGGLHANLFFSLPPFQIDANYGHTAAVAEMLLQSQNRDIDLLPALPDAWEQGHITGMKARGGYEVDFSWKAHQVEKIRIRAMKPGEVVLKYNGKENMIRFTADQLEWTAQM